MSKFRAWRARTVALVLMAVVPLGYLGVRAVECACGEACPCGGHCECNHG